MNSHDKGKGKTASAEKLLVQGPQKNDDPPSLSSRVLSSASALTRQTLSNPRDGLFTSPVVENGSSNSKPHASSSAVALAAGGESSTWSQARARNPFSPSLHEHGFKESREAHFSLPSEIDAEAAEFKLCRGTGGNFNMGESASLSGEQPEGVSRKCQVGKQKPPMASTRIGHWRETELADGLEVRQLLSNPVTPNFEDPSYGSPSIVNMDLVEVDPQVNDPFKEGSHQRKLLNGLLPAPPIHRVNEAHIIRDLKPRFDENDSVEGYLAAWSEVLHSYTDDVWGPHMMEINDAKQQIKDLQESANVKPNEKALRRLGMVLEHIKANSAQ